MMTNGYQASTPSSSSSTLTFDANGNMTSDGTNSYAWDAEDRLIKITYPGTNNYSTFSYDGLDRNVEIAETRSGSVTSTKQFVWAYDDDENPCESRDSSGNLISQFFARGQTIGSANYYKTKDFPGSTRDLTDASGNIQAQLVYDPFGQAVRVQGALSPDFQYAGYYFHAPSGLSLTRNRAFSSSLGRWINRDPNEEDGGINLYAYVSNNPISFTDPSGLGNKALCCKAKQDAARLKAELEKRIQQQQDGSTDPKIVKQHIKAFIQTQTNFKDALRRWRLYCPDKPPKEYEDLEHAKPPVPNPQNQSNNGTLPMVPYTPLSPAVGPMSIPGLPELPVPIFEPLP